MVALEALMRWSLTCSRAVHAGKRLQKHDVVGHVHDAGVRRVASSCVHGCMQGHVAWVGVQATAVGRVEPSGPRRFEPRAGSAMRVLADDAVQQVVHGGRLSSNGQVRLICGWSCYCRCSCVSVDIIEMLQRDNSKRR